MKIEKAIKTAIEYEIKVRDVYKNAVNKCADPVGKRIYQILAEDEERHVQYFNTKLRELINTGKVTFGKLASAIPSREAITKGVRELKAHLSERDSGRSKSEVETLKKALELEQETSRFYETVADELEGEEREFFLGLVKVEESHEAFVQAQIDCVARVGIWFDPRRSER